LHVLDVSHAVEGVEGAGVSEFKDDFRAWEPVGALAVDEMADDVAGAPGAVTFVGAGPGIGKAAEERVERGGGAGEQCGGVAECLFHRETLFILSIHFIN